MFKKVSIIKKVAAGMIAGMMIGSFIPAQAFSIKGSLDKAKMEIQRYWRENKAFRVVVSSGMVVAGLALWSWKMKKNLNVKNAEVQRRQTDCNDAESRYEATAAYLDHLRKNNPTCRLWRKHINCRINPVYLRKYAEVSELIRADFKAKKALYEAMYDTGWWFKDFIFSFPSWWVGYFLIATGLMELKKELWDAN